MENYTFIDNLKKLVDFRRYLSEKNVTKIAMDFEGEYNLHCYGEKLCLIQIFDGENYFVIDPLKIEDVEIGKMLNNPGIVKYMYGAESDIGSVYKQYGIKMSNVYDQKILVDVLDLEKKGLDGVINILFGIENKAKAKYQKYNWVKRPIENNAIIYALNDVKYLFQINNLLTERIIAENKVNDLIIKIIGSNFDFDKTRIPGIFKKNEFKTMSSGRKKLFTEIYEIREGCAKSLNMPPHNVLENNILFAIVNRKIDPDSIKFNSKIPKELILKIQNVLRGTLSKGQDPA